MCDTPTVYTVLYYTLLVVLPIICAVVLLTYAFLRWSTIRYTVRYEEVLREIADPSSVSQWSVSYHRKVD